MKKEILVLGVLILMIGSALAFDTTITVKSDDTVDVRLYNYLMQKVQENLRVEPNSNDEVIINYSSSLDKITVVTFVKSDNDEGDMQKFEDLKTGGEIYIDLTTDTPSVSVKEQEVEEIINETEQVEQEVVEEIINETEIINNSEEVSEANKTISGFVVFGENNNNLFYIIGVLIILVVGFILYRNHKKRDTTEHFKVRKFGELQKREDDEEVEDYDGTEKRLELAEQEINKIKERNNKLKQAQENYKKAKEDLDQLRKEEL